MSDIGADSPGRWQPTQFLKTIGATSLANVGEGTGPPGVAWFAVSAAAPIATATRETQIVTVLLMSRILAVHASEFSVPSSCSVFGSAFKLSIERADVARAEPERRTEHEHEPSTENTEV
jgi:hypothetical protein